MLKVSDGDKHRAWYLALKQSLPCYQGQKQLLSESELAMKRRSQKGFLHKADMCDKTHLSELAVHSRREANTTHPKGAQGVNIVNPDEPIKAKMASQENTVR